MVAVEALMGAPVETPFFFPAGAPRLFGVFHEPASADTGEAFVFCHPFGEEKLWAHRVFVGTARELARRGHAVLRFDYRGNGDSDGSFTETSLTTNLADIQVAIDWLKARRHLDTVGLLGLRLGATEAALLAERRSDVSTLVLWNPLSDGARYMQELLRINLATQLATQGAVTLEREALVEQMRAGTPVNIDGYDLALPFYEQVSAIRIEPRPGPFAGRCLIVQADRAGGAPPGRDLVDFQARFPAATVRQVREEPFWKEIQRFYETTDQLCAVTMEWLSTR